MNYTEIQPIESVIPADRQGAKRHYGVHPYFTRRPYNVVREYILRFTKEGDKVLDPFGGSGVTAIEAFLENRIGIQNDINPLANFIAQGIANLERETLENYYESLTYLKEICQPKILEIYNSDNDKLKETQAEITLPENIDLPKSADVSCYYNLFSLKQLLSLSVIKNAIDLIDNSDVRKGLLIAWSATLAKVNKTFLSTNGRAESRGGSSIFSIYRYKVAKQPIELPVWETFYERAENVIKAKKEIETVIEFKKRKNNGWMGKFEVYSEDVEELGYILQDSIDYIFTDPPYGGHISYLDLSTLWNAWLGYLPDRKTKEKELIVGGDLKLSENYYVEKLGRSVDACSRMLKKDRWFSIVFQHWNISYFEAILSSAANSGLELKAAVSQVGDPIWSMHKKKNESILAGELILTFQKTEKETRLCNSCSFNVSDFLGDILREYQEDKIYGEFLFNRIIVEAWKNSAIHSLNISKESFTSILKEEGWFYDKQNHYWSKKKFSNTLFPL